MSAARRAVITGVGIVAPTGLDAGDFLRAALGERPIGSPEAVATLRGRTQQVRVARIPGFDREAHLPSRSLRRMGNVSQVWTIACLLARAGAGLSGEAPTIHPPERRGTYLGTGFGCIDATWDYLVPVMQEGASTASPFLFSESVANAPAGHSSIAVDTRGTAVTFTCADSSAAVAVSRAAEAIRQGRVDVAWAGGIDLMVPPLLRVLAALGVPAVSEGAVCFVLEEAEAARRRGARAFTEVAAGGLASDPRTAATQWPRDAAAWENAMRRAGAPETAARVAEIYLHGPTDPRAREAEQAAAMRLFRAARVVRAGDAMGMFGAGGGFPLAAAVLAATQGDGAKADVDRLVSSGAWGGTLACVRLTHAHQA
jgi:3-oxoacyl-[acyl-carrier-protein] synthase II